MAWHEALKYLAGIEIEGVSVSYPHDETPDSFPEGEAELPVMFPVVQPGLDTAVTGELNSNPSGWTTTIRIGHILILGERKGEHWAVVLGGMVKIIDDYLVKMQANATLGGLLSENLTLTFSTEKLIVWGGREYVSVIFSHQWTRFIGDYREEEIPF
jgi:hypothetical protein